MRIYIIGNDGITLCREAPESVTDGEITVASQEELHAAPLSGKRLLALWNGTLARFLGHGWRDVGGRDVAGRANGGEGRLGGEPSARGYVKATHTRCKMGGAQQEGHEMRRDMRESTVVLCRRVVLEG
jgi:hypothetical protein